jgi:hypothetical protein
MNTGPYSSVLYGRIEHWNSSLYLCFPPFSVSFIISIYCEQISHKSIFNFTFDEKDVYTKRWAVILRLNIIMTGVMICNEDPV